MVKILIVDSDRMALETTVSVVKKSCQDAEIVAMNDGMEAVQYGLNNNVDLVYTEILMTRISGFDVARLIQKFRPKAAIYLVSQTDKYLNIAIRQGLQGYYLKPLIEKTFPSGNLMKQEIINVQAQDRAF